MRTGLVFASALVLFQSSFLVAQNPECKITQRHLSNKLASQDFAFEGIKSPSATDVGGMAELSVLSGRIDANSGGLECLNDGVTPSKSDEPARNFFIENRRGNLSRVRFDLMKPIEVQEIRTYSWHPNVRSPQVFRVYGATDEVLTKKDLKDDDTPTDFGWQQIASVDSRESGESLGGQYATSIQAKNDESLGKFRYVLFEILPTSDRSRNAATFFSEIDIEDGKSYELAGPKTRIDTLKIGDRFTIHIDTTEVPELQPWVQEELTPVCKEWYPRLVEMLPSENYAAPEEFSIVFKANMDGVAFASGRQITAAGPWYRRNLEGEAKGSIVHEMVHIVQQYRRTRRGNRNPGWMVEGLADYIRWFQYEPEQNRPRINPARSNYDDSYRTSAAFLNFAVEQYGDELIPKFNAHMREGTYNDGLWKEFTGKSAEEIWADFANSLRK